MEDKFIDVHAHLSDPSFTDRKKELFSMLKDSYLVLNAGENSVQDRKILDESRNLSFLLPCIGLHPNEIARMAYEDAEKELAYFSQNIADFFAVSEVGLDYRGKDTYQMEQEKEFFYRILELSEINKKVCIIHSRKAIEDVFDAVSSFKIKAILHNFEGNLRNLIRAEELGLYISISTGFMKFKKDNIIKNVSLDKLFTETDSPVLSPDSGINTPLNLPKLLNYISSIRNMDMNDLKSAVSNNFREVFYD